MEYWEILIGIIISALTAGFGIYKFSKAREDEFKKVYWQKRYENYSKVLELTSKIAVSKNLEIVQEEIKEFRQYYWGKLAMIETQAVLSAMVSYEKALKDLEGSKEKNFFKLEEASYLLAIACRNSLKETWEPVPMTDIEK